MALREILHYPDPRLRENTAEVDCFDDELARLIDDMAETMYAAPGVGLAAPQIGVLKRLFIVDVVSDDDSVGELLVFANPEILTRDGVIVWEEGCLSFPGIREDVERAERVGVRAQDQTGAFFEMEAEGLLAVAIQHEYDHLNGKLMVDHLGPIRRRLVHRTMIKRS